MKRLCYHLIYMNRDPFWKAKNLEEMTREEWESLCDGCALCCLEKKEDEDTGRITFTAVPCEFLDTVTCRCLIYDYRTHINPECVELSPDNVTQISRLPYTCAYRCLAEGRELEWWHPLVSGDPETVHQAGISVRDKVLPGKQVHPEDSLGTID